MSALLTSWAGSTASGVMAKLVGHTLSKSSERVKEIRAGRKSTAADLVAPLRELQRLLRRYGVEDVGREETACDNWWVTLEGQGHRLPRELRYVPRNVKEAVGTVFGGVVYIHTFPEAKRWCSVS